METPQGGTHTITVESNPKPGFYKNGSTYIQCKNYGFCEVVTPTGDCTDDNTGKLIKKGSKDALCLGNFDPDAPVPGTAPKAKGGRKLLKRSTKELPSLEFLTDGDDATNNYLVKHIPGDNVFSFHKEANYYAVIRPDVNSIVFNDALVKTDSAALVDEGKLIARQDELCNIEKSSGRYYTCDKGICKSTKKTSKAGVYELNGESKSKYSFF